MSDTPETDNNAYECIQRFEMGGSTTAEKQSCQQGDCVSADFARKLERERDEAIEERNAALSDRDAWARLCNAADCYTPSTAEPYEALKLQLDALRAEVERLKAEAELYSGWSKWKDGIWCISQVESGPCAEWIADDITSAMKGAE